MFPCKWKIVLCLFCVSLVGKLIRTIFIGAIWNDISSMLCPLVWDSRRLIMLVRSVARDGKSIRDIQWMAWLLVWRIFDFAYNGGNARLRINVSKLMTVKLQRIFLVRIYRHLALKGLIVGQSASKFCRCDHQSENFNGLVLQVRNQ